MASAVVTPRPPPGVGRTAVTGGQDAPDHGGQVGREQHGGAEALLHLRGVPVVEQAVGHEVFVHRAEVEVLGRARPAPETPLAASTMSGATARSVDPEVPGRHQPGPDQRPQGEDGRGGIAARGGDQTGAASSSRCSSGRP